MARGKLYPLRQRPVTAVTRPPLIIPKRGGGVQPGVPRNFAYLDGSVVMQSAWSLGRSAGRIIRFKFKAWHSDVAFDTVKAIPIGWVDGIMLLLLPDGTYSIDGGGSLTPSVGTWLDNQVNEVVYDWADNGSTVNVTMNGVPASGALSNTSPSDLTISGNGQPVNPGIFVGFIWDVELDDVGTTVITPVSRWPANEGAGDVFVDTEGIFDRDFTALTGSLIWQNDVVEPTLPPETP